MIEKIKLDQNEYYLQRDNELESNLELRVSTSYSINNAKIYKDLNFLNKRFTKFYKVILQDTYEIMGIYTITILEVFDFTIANIMDLKYIKDFNIYGNKFNIIHNAIEQDKYLIVSYLYGLVKEDISNDTHLDILQTAIENCRYDILDNLLKSSRGIFNINYEEGFLLYFAYYHTKDPKACSILLQNGATILYTMSAVDKLKILITWMVGVKNVIEIWKFCTVRISNLMRYWHWGYKDL